MSPRQPGLQGIAAELRAHLVRRARLALALWWVVLVGCALVAAWLMAGPAGWRQGSRGPVVLDAVALVLGLVGVALLRRGTRRWFDEAHLSGAMEEAAGLPSGVVRGSLELSRHVPPGVSAALAAQAAAGTAARLDRPPPELGGPLGRRVAAWTRRGAGATAAVAVTLALLGVTAPSRAKGAWRGLSAPLRVAAQPTPAPVSVTPGDVEVPRGDDVEVQVVAPGLETVELAWQAAGEVAHAETLTLHGGAAAKRFARVAATLDYRVRTPDGRTTRSYRITPVDPLFVSDVKVEVVYPPNTGLPPDEFHGAVPPLRLPVGTRLQISGRTSRPLSAAGLTDVAGRPVVTMRVRGAGFGASWTPTAPGRFPWSFRDGRGAPAAIQPDPLEISLLADSAPMVAIPLPGVDTVMPLGRRQPLIVEARDDYGLSRLEVVAWRVPADGEPQPPDTMGIDLAGTRAAMARPLLNMTGWGLLPGDHVRYFARAVDNAPHPHETRTREYVLRVPDASEIRRLAQQRLDSMTAAVRKMADEADRHAQENRNREMQSAAAEQAAEETRDRAGLRRDAGSDQGDFQQRQEVKKALDEQRALAARVDSMKDEISALKRSMEDAGQADPQLAKDLEELRKLMDQASGSGARAQLEALAKRLDGMQADAGNRTLASLAAQQEKLRDRLQQSLERFRRAAAGQEFRATTSDAEELARQEHALADALRDPHDPVGPERRAEQQRELERRTGALSARMDTLRQRLDRLEEKAASGAVAQARERSEEARRRMTQARTGAAGGRRQSAGQAVQADQADQAEQAAQAEQAEQAEQAARSLDAAARQLGAAQKRMSRQSEESARHALSRAADDALGLARRQTALRRGMEGAPQERVLSLRRDEEALLQGAHNLAQNVTDGTRGAVAGNAAFSQQLGRVLTSVQHTIDVMGGQRSPTPVPLRAADQAVDALNRLALLALAGSEQMSRQPGQNGQGNRDTQQQIQQLAQQEGDLVNKTGQLTPMQLGEQALKEQLRKLAEEQQRLSDELSNAARRPDAKDRTLGDLQALATEARELAEQMAQGRLTPDMMKRQGKLFHRLLDAGRSLESNDEFSDERESKAAGAVQPMVVAPLTADQLGALRYGLPDAEQLQRLPPAVRRLVIDYFERLNSRGGGGGGR